ncbi:MAG: DUF2489 domain-containing protein [Gammaproteobacteria bacterium]|nr:MAG: DUF2489 domain-containing protein [Gammaproteobacteria bacterium]
MTLLLLLGVLIIVCLAGYAIYLQRQLQHRKAAREEQARQLASELDERREHYRKSIQILAAALEADQMTLTEGAIRISMLASQLDLDESEQEHYQVFFQLTQATAHIPILEDWKKLSTRDKLRFDRERVEIEEKYREFVVEAARQVIKKKQSASNEALFYSVDSH